jgi:dephospho-CoA kinase
MNSATLSHLAIGLTGGIGSGKSSVAKLFEQAGARIIDTDLISHQLTQSGGSAMDAIRRDFGDEFINADGALDRSKMRTFIFADPAAKKRLENILHPLIREQVLRLAASHTTAPYTLAIVPLLAESNHYHWLHRIIVVDCSEQAQLTRTIQRSGLNETTVRAIMATQASRSQRLQKADDIIENDGPAELLAGQVARLHRTYLALVAGSN